MVYMLLAEYLKPGFMIRFCNLWFSLHDGLEGSRGLGCRRVKMYATDAHNSVQGGRTYTKVEREGMMEYGMGGWKADCKELTFFKESRNS